MSERPTRDAPPNLTDYEAERSAFALDVPPRFNAVRDVVEARASTHPDDLALLSVAAESGTRTRHTYAELAETAFGQAAALMTDTWKALAQPI